MASTDESLDSLTELERDAARGVLPDWARASTKRREHMGRVAALMEDWAAKSQLSESEVLRWAAAAWLHDVLRDEDPSLLRREVAPEERDLPGPVLHGPAAASRLKGMVDARVLKAIRYHTIGHSELDTMGRALYLADFLEPGRDFEEDWRADLRRRMPGDLNGVLVEVVAARIRHLLDRMKPIRPETASFWTAIVTSGRP